MVGLYNIYWQYKIDVIIVGLPLCLCLSWESVWVVVMVVVVVAVLSTVPPVLHRLPPAPPLTSQHHSPLLSSLSSQLVGLFKY